MATVSQWAGEAEAAERYLGVSLPLRRRAVHVPIGLDFERLEAGLVVAAFQSQMRHRGCGDQALVGPQTHLALHPAPGELRSRHIVHRLTEGGRAEDRLPAAVETDHRVDSEGGLPTEIMVEHRLDRTGPLRHRAHLHPAGARIGQMRNLVAHIQVEAGFGSSR